MDVETVIGSILSSGIVSLALARYLGERIVDHRLTKDLKDYQQRLDAGLAVNKSRLDVDLASFKAHVEATLRRDVEEHLGDLSADRQYRLDARKRLYAAIGPLRFQLIVAARDLANRIDRIGRGDQPYTLTLNEYFGKSTAFRLIRVLGLIELIERQMAYADFAVDPSTVALLQFKHKVFLCLSGGSVVLRHPSADWQNQSEHIFFDTISIVSAAAVIRETEGRERVMRFDEFDAFVTTSANLKAIHPVPQLIETFSVSSKPILWLRFVALAGLCAQLVAREGPQSGIKPEKIDLARLIDASGDDHTVKHRGRYLNAIERMSSLEAELDAEGPKSAATFVPSAVTSSVRRPQSGA